MTDPKNDPKQKQERGPNYPSLNLSQGIEKARILYQKEGRNSVAPEAIASHWGWTPRSSTFVMALSALRKFGLLQDAGDTGSGNAKLTSDALTILLTDKEEDKDRSEAIQRLALKPKLFAEMWEKYKEQLPSEANIKVYLVRDKGFREQSASSFWTNYLETISFAKLIGDGKITEGAASGSDQSAAKQQNVKPQSQPGATMRDFAIPLGPDGGVATLNLPVPINEKSFALITGWLTAMKDGIVSADKGEADKKG